jgi:hypothetical protein
METEGQKLVYSLPEVAELTGFPLRSLQRQCRAGKVEHIHYGRYRGMTAEQIRKLVADHFSGERATTSSDLDEAREFVLKLAAREAAKRR